MQCEGRRSVPGLDVKDATDEGHRSRRRWRRGQQPAPGALRLEVWGEKGGTRVHRMVCSVGQMRETAAICLPAGTQMLARKELAAKEGDVYAPGACLDPQAFM